MKHQIYVSPVGNGWTGDFERPTSLDFAPKALHLVHEKHGYADGTEVIFRGGAYFMRSPLSFDDRACAPLTYRAYEGERPVFIGGQPLDLWEGEYKGRRAWFSHIADVAAGKRHNRCHILIVNEERRPRTRLPEGGFYRFARVPNIDFEKAKTNPVYRLEVFKGTDTFEVFPGDVEAWENIQDVDIVAVHYWVEERMPIARFDEKTHTVVVKNCSSMSLDDSAELYARYYVENVKEALNKQGQWYLDKKTGLLTYLPYDHEKIEESTVVLPNLTEAVVMNGSSLVTLEGLTFNGFDRVDEGGFGRGNAPVLMASSAQSACMVGGAIEITESQHITIKDCKVLNVEKHGICVNSGCQHIKILGNEIAHSGAGAIKVNGVKSPVNDQLKYSAELPTRFVTITDNHLHDIGKVFLSASVVLIMNASHCVVSHNEIHDGFYTGISLGWMWGYADTVNANHTVEYNHIYDLGKHTLADFGGIYTLGNQTGTVLRGNVIHDLERSSYGGWGIYPDEGTTNMLIEDNLVYRTDGCGFHQHYGKENMVRNNILAYGHDGAAGLGRAEPHNSIYFYNNIYITDNMPFYTGGYSGDIRKPNYRSDLNLFWNEGGPQPEQFSANAGRNRAGIYEVRESLTFDEWQALGQDRHSVYANPGFADIKNGDYSGADQAILDLIGFKLPDWSKAGIRKP